jgi:hypothetical protein
MIEIVYSNCWVGSIMWIVDVGAPPPSPFGNFSSLPPSCCYPFDVPLRSPDSSCNCIYQSIRNILRLINQVSSRKLSIFFSQEGPYHPPGRPSRQLWMERNMAASWRDIPGPPLHLLLFKEQKGDSKIHYIHITD